MRKELSFEPYLEFVDFLGEVLGENVEIVLHDLTNLEESIIAIKNGQISGRRLGGPVTDLVLRMMKDVEFKDINYVTNYKSESKNGKMLHSATYLIRDDQKRVYGMMCFNFDYSEHYAIQQSLDRILPKFMSNKETEEKQMNGISEKLNDSIENLVNGSIQELTFYHEFVPQRLVQEEKIDIVRGLHDKGVFLMKGAVLEVALQLQMSEATVYRYLSMIKRSE
ncbi:PAS domain-containing protein [Gottschalkiaceae bacterium SANA]|nr:PAS domain-containing protein [Gottschalkiaceae bacterium SANA]